MRNVALVALIGMMAPMIAYGEEGTDLVIPQKPAELSSASKRKPNAEAAPSDINNVSLEDLLSMKVTVASGSKSKALTTRESPSIVSVITEDEIRKSGARDMLDILRMVPGFSVQSGADNSFSLTPALRGIKVGEGKMLLQINGFSFVDLSYVNVQVFNRFPVDQIKQVEIIRGPGSAIYGGHAELTVINIALKDGKDLQGNYVNAFYSQMEKSYARKNLSYATGGSEGDLKYSVNTYFGNAELGDKNFTDEAGTTYRFDKNTGYDTRFINLNNTYKNLTTRFLYADYKIQNTDNYYTSGPPYNIRWTNLAGSVAYDIKAMDEKLIITPSLDFNRNGAWNVTEDWTRGTGNWNTDVFDQAHARINALYEISKQFDIIGGVEHESNDSQFHNDQSTDKHIYYTTLGTYLQGTAKLGTLNFTAGGRYEQNTVNSKKALVPRVALTTVNGPWHLKALYSEAYRTPSGTQYILQQNVLEPEKAKVKEIEVGFQASRTDIITANVFDTLITGALRYAALGYANTTSNGTRGGEIEYKHVDSWGNLGASFSYYEATKRGNGNVASTIDDKATIGLPRLKYTLNSTFNITNDLSLSGQYEREDKVYAFTDSTFTEKKLDPADIVNVYLLYRNAFNLEKFDLGFGVWNLLDADIWFPTQEKSGQSPPLPGPSREYGLRVAYSF